ncbi:predicted protein [Postia placenta Mad-698-R]|nr:predicted protein [Postia placenta Mad-698-R]
MLVLWMSPSIITEALDASMPIFAEMHRFKHSIFSIECDLFALIAGAAEAWNGSEWAIEIMCCRSHTTNKPSIISVNLATIAIESMLYGIFLVLASSAIYLHLSRARSHHSSFPRVHWILTVTRLFAAFVNFHGGNDPTYYLSNLSFATEIVKTAFFVVTLIISDVLFIQRLWIVWGYNNYIIILPVCTFLGLCDSLDLNFSQWQDPESYINVRVWEWAQYSRSQSAAGYTLTTALLSSQRVVVTVVESATIYSYDSGERLDYRAYTIFYFVSYQVRSNIQFTAIDTLCTVCGITFMLVNVRVGLGWAQRAQSSTNPSSHSSSGSNATSFRMRPVAVNITRVVDETYDTRSAQKIAVGESILPV